MSAREVSWPTGSRVRIKHGGERYTGLDGTVVGPATQAGMDVVVQLDEMWPAEFRNWELGVIPEDSSAQPSASSVGGTEHE